jgi:gliding motility-associated-like protein
MKINYKIFRIFSSFLLFLLLTNSQIIFGQLVTTQQTPANAVLNSLAGTGVSITNIQFTGAPQALGSFAGNVTNMGFNAGVVITTGTILTNSQGPIGPNNSSNAGQSNGFPGDVELTTIAGITTFDASILEFDFTANANLVSFRYIFGSEEYPEFVNSGFNDVFAFFISGPGIAGIQNMAQLPGGAGVVSIDNVNINSNSAFYINNTGAGVNGLQYDGFTIPIVASSQVICGQTYHLKIAIADAGDGIFDSGIFLEAGSLTANSNVDIQSSISNNVFFDPTILAEGCTNGTITLTRSGTQIGSALTIPINMLGTALQGIDYSNIPTSISFAAGQTVQTINFSTIADLLTEGSETMTFVFGIPDPCNAIATTNISLFIQDNPPLVLTLVDQILPCIGDQVTLNSSVTGNNGGQLSYLWSNGQTTPSITLSPTSTQFYTLTVTGNCSNQVASGNVTVIVNPLPVVDAGADQTICIGSTVTFNGTGAILYHWENNINISLNGSVPSQNPTTSFTLNTNAIFILTGTDAFGCIDKDTAFLIVNPLPIVSAGVDQTICAGNSSLLTHSGAVDYTWTPSNLYASDSVSPLQTTTYVLTGIDVNGCSNTDSVTIFINALPLVNAGLDQTICEGVTTLISGSGGVSYVWNPGNLAAISAIVSPQYTSSYFMEATDVNGCKNRDTLIVVVHPLPLVSINPIAAVCEGSNVILTATGALSYSWSNGLPNGSIIIPSVGTTNLTVLGIDQFNCENSANVDVIAHPNPVLNLIFGPNLGCAPYEFTFQNNGSSTSCNFQFDNSDVQYACGQQSHIFSIPGCHTFKYTSISDQGCLTTQDFGEVVCVAPTPIAQFSVEPSVLSSEDLVANMFNQSSGASQYVWQFGDGTSTTQINTNHDFEIANYEDGYTTQLIAINSQGCRDTAYHHFNVNEELIMYVPNTFTPDGDLFNETFKPIITSGFDPQKYTLLIFNRYGETIFESHDTNVGWNGTYSGKSVQDDTYIWTIQIGSNANDKKYRKKGHVNVLK